MAAPSPLRTRGACASGRLPERHYVRAGWPQQALVGSLALLVLVAGVWPEPLLAVSHEAAWRIATPLIGFEVAPNGTGDAVAALFSAHWIESGDVPAALGKAASSIYAVLEATLAMGERELQLVAAQDRMISPSRRFTAEKL